MDMRWINKEREIYNKERVDFSQLIKQSEANGTTVLEAFKKNAERFNGQVKVLKEAIDKSTNAAEKLKLYYQLIATKNLLDENNEILAIFDKYKKNLSDPDARIAMSKTLKAENIYYTELANHFDTQLHDMQAAYINRAKHLALLEVNPPIEALQKLNVHELHHSHLSMQELARSNLAKEYDRISAALDEASQKEYQLYSYLDKLCQSVIKSADREKEARNNSSQVQTNTNTTNEKPKVFTYKATMFGNSTHEAANKDTLKLKNLQHDLEQRKVEIHQQLAQMKSEMATGKFDNLKLANLQFEDKLVNRSLSRIAQTFDIAKSNLMSVDYVKQQIKTRSEAKTINVISQSHK